MFHKFLKYISQSISGMIGVSVYILADTFFISYKCGADGLAALNLILPVFGLVFAIGSMIGIGSATRYNISTAQGYLRTTILPSPSSGVSYAAFLLCSPESSFRIKHLHF